MSFSRDKALAMMLGLALGDALGASVEFMTRDQIQQQFASTGGRVTAMVGGGWLDLQPGQCTDDTAMATMLLQSLADNKCYRRQDTLQRYMQWFESCPRDIGDTIAGTLTAINAGVPVEQAARRCHQLRGRSASNGSLMRIAPLSLIDDPVARKQAVISESTLTHWDDRATQCCLLYVKALRACLENKPPVFASANRHIKPVLDWSAGQAIEANKDNIGYVPTTLGTAIWASHSDNFKRRLCDVVSMGGDADTNGAVSGALLGAKLGTHSLPPSWLELLHPREQIGQTIKQMLGNR